MSRVKIEELNDFLEVKKQSFSIRVTTYLKGTVKNKFIDDCKKREINESKMAGEIIDFYYTIYSSMPNIHGKEMIEIKKIISEKIKI